MENYLTIIKSLVFELEDMAEKNNLINYEKSVTDNKNKQLRSEIESIAFEASELKKEIKYLKEQLPHLVVVQPESEN